MEIILIALIVALLNSALFFIDGILTSIVPITLYAERYMDTVLGTTGFESLYKLMFDFAISLIILKFLKKVFDVYICWLDGDMDSDPINLINNFVKALVVAISSKTLYEWLAKIVEDLINQMLSAIGADMNQNWALVIDAIASAGIFTAIITLVFFICFFIMYIQFLMRGMEMLILRIGLPIVCVGLIDSDKGIFGSYIKKFFQSVVTIIVQLCLVKLSIGLMANQHIFWAIAAINLAIKTPKFVQEFMLTVSSGGGIGNNIYHISRLAQMTKQVISKVKG